jgi:alkylation response protein AidB-like acyl-CoA dehydrogenase
MKAKPCQGFMLTMLNFNHERAIIAYSACRSARLCYEEAIKWALQRKTFGKRLVDHQIIRSAGPSMACRVLHVAHRTLFVACCVLHVAPAV